MVAFFIVIFGDAQSMLLGLMAALIVVPVGGAVVFGWLEMKKEATANRLYKAQVDAQIAAMRAEPA